MSDVAQEILLEEFSPEQLAQNIVRLTRQLAEVNAEKVALVNANNLLLHRLQQQEIFNSAIVDAVNIQLGRSIQTL